MSSDHGHPNYIPIPMQPLRSALKHTSRPSTPISSPSSARPSTSPSPFIPASPSANSSIIASSTGLSSIVSDVTAHPTPNGYTPKVSFDTFENPAASMFSFTLQVKSEDYVRTRSTREFLCAASPDESGRQALEWALESLVQDGDELVVFRGVDTEDLEKDHDEVREEARALMRLVQEKSVEYDPDRKLSIIVEFIAGKVTETLDRLIALYRPDSVVVGTRGQRGVRQAWGAAFGAPGVGSVSKYCLSHSPVPIIVVRPERKVRKVLAKRRADPKRGTHFDDAARPKTADSAARPRTAGVPLTPNATKS